MSGIAESKCYEFDEFKLDANTRRLFRRESGEVIPLQPKAFELLLFLVESDGRMLTKNELLDSVWKGSFVEEGNLSQTIFVLRKALHENKKEPHLIVTLPNLGYRFIANVKALDSDLSEHLSLEEARDRGLVEAKTRRSKILLAGISLLLLSLPVVYWFYPTTKPVTVQDTKTVAVLPFKNIGGKADEEYLGQGLSEVLITKLSKIKSIVVRPASAVMRYTDSSPDPQRIGTELNVDALVIGRVQKVGENIRVTIQFVRVSDNATLWAETFDDKYTNIFAVQDSISQQITETLAIKLTRDERQQIAKNYTENAEAFQYYLEGLYLWNKRTPETLLKAIGEFEKASQIDPNYAPAYIGLANCYVVLSNYGITTPHEAFPKAKEAIMKALEIDEQLAEAHAALADMQTYYDWDWKAAELSFKRAIELNPNYATAHQWYAEFLFDMGRFEEAFSHYERAIQIEPRSAIIWTSLASRYYFLRQYDKVIEYTKKVHEIDPNYGYSYFHLGLAYEDKGLYPEAVEALTKTMTLLGEPSDCVEEVKAAFRKSGINGFWRKRLEQLETRPHLKNYPAMGIASVYVRLGNKEKAFEWLEKGYKRRDPWMVALKVAIDFDSLKDDPRFQEILVKMNFQ